MRPRHVFLLLVLLAIPAGIAAVRAAPEDTATEGPVTTRYRMEVWRIQVPNGEDASPLTLADLGLDSGPAVLPVADAPRAAGWVGAVPVSPEVLGAVAALPGSESVFRLETEGAPRESVVMEVHRQFPVLSVDVRGNQTIETTKFERTGAEAKITHRQGDVVELRLGFAAVSALVQNRTPILFSMQSSGVVTLPDGYVAVFQFTDRVDSRFAGSDLERVVRYLVLLTRLDLTR
jgi:hypothetical protein